MTTPTIPAAGSLAWLDQETRSGLMQSIALQQAYDAVCGAQVLREKAGEVTPAEEALVASLEHYVRKAGEFPLCNPETTEKPREFAGASTAFRYPVFAA
jgi:hypothetical protein